MERPYGAAGFSDLMEIVDLETISVAPASPDWTSKLVDDSDSYSSVKFSDLDKLFLLQKGEGGDEIYEVVDRQTGRSYTLKEFVSPLRSSLTIGGEFQFLKKLNHPNIVKCYEFFEMGDRNCLLLENMNRGSLEGVSFTSLDVLASVAYQVLQGLKYLHQKRIFHGEVKPANVFMNLKQVKVLYLGNYLSSTSEFSGTPAIPDKFSWDLWNLGLSILKLYNGSHRMFKDSAFKEFTNTSLSQPIREPSEELWRFLECCMGIDLSQRWTAETLLNHPFFNRQCITELWETGAMGDSQVLSLFVPPFKSISSFGKEEQISAKKENDRSLPSAAAESSLCTEIKSAISFGEEEQLSPKKKKYKMLLANKDSINIVETSKDSINIVEKGYFGYEGVTDYMSRCIQHCFLFYPNCEFEKDKLIQMWIAEECIEVEGIERVEDVASKCFDDLVNMEVIIPMGFNSPYRERIYKVSTSQDSTRFVEGCDYLRIDEGQFHEVPREASHLLWKCKRLDPTLSCALKNFKQLRTLRVVKDRGFPNEQIPNGIFLGLKELRTLDLSYGDICMLPGSIGTMKSLRYLDVSNTPIKELPESTARLSRLQALKLRNCSRLRVLPREFRNLKQLRHLDLDIVGQLNSMPKGMGSLTELQTLKAFLVGKNDGFRIAELGNMNEISGSFSIIGLENVSSAEEANKAALTNKKRIDKLVLRWSDNLLNDASEILECLQPHYNLGELMIICFSCLKLPTWISNPSYANLSSITLLKCTGCDMLPSLGGLPSLKILHIEMESVRSITDTFCRSASNQKPGAFRMLEKLKLDKMLNLQEWTGIQDGDFPCLRHICITYCPKLTLLPSMSHLNSLQHLELCYCVQLASLPEGLLPDSVDSLIINDCPNLNQRCLKDKGEDWVKISSIKEFYLG